MHKIWILLFFSGILFSSCQKENDPVKEGNPKEGKFEQSSKSVLLSEEEQYGLQRYLSQDFVEQIDSIVSLYNERRNFHGSMLVMEKGNVIFENQYGYYDIGQNKKIEAETPFQLASVSKPITATAILKLKEQGKVALSDSISCFFPELPYDATVYQLLNHTAGLPNYMWLIDNKWKKSYAPYNDDIIEMMAKEELNPHFFSGRRHAYSNTGYILLASIIERVTGQKYGEYLENEVFEPLGMENSFVLSTAFECRSDKVAKGYRQNWRGNYSVTGGVQDGPVGDKGIYSTARDLSKWLKAFSDNRLISEETRKKAFEPLTLRNGNNYPYGLGWRLKKDQDPSYVYHNGLWFGFRASMQWYKEKDAAIIVLNNTNNRNLNQLSSVARNRLFKERDKSYAERVVAKMIEKPGESLDYYIQETYNAEKTSNEDLNRELSLLKDILEKINRDDLAHDLSEAVESWRNEGLVQQEDEEEDETTIGGDL